ncbi:MAG: T9SS type B sorting domain-containing protein [Bacteroidia bacterium]
MKKIITYLFILLTSQIVSAQITYTIEKSDVKCNNSELGKAQVDITSTDGPYTFLWNTGQTTPAVTDLENGTYSVHVTGASLEDTTIYITINTSECSMVGEIVFTPNGDGTNDTWGINNSEYFPNAWVLVYNRLGQKVFDHKGLYEPWDGKDLFGVPVPDSSYFYIIYEDKSDEKSIIKGTVSIIK